ncbi:MAG: hypothetical protein PHH85_03480 [Candidatus Methanoperedens sp.]|nr:hypothetical protein [Candidatus Methanoperedens sp.]
MNVKTHSAGSKPALRHIKVFSTEHEQIMKNVSLLEVEYFKRAQALNIPIRKKGKYRNVPGQAEAMEYFFAGISMSEYIETLIGRANTIIQRQQGAQHA